MSLEIIILAAGQGTRMKSALPKVLHCVAGKPILQHVIDAAQALSPTRIHVVVGHGMQQILEQISDETLNWVEQSEQLGTGHAVQQAISHITEDSNVLVLYGDVPLISAQCLQLLVESMPHFPLALLTARVDDATGYGRILHDEAGAVCGIIEHKDASSEQRQINEINTGFVCARRTELENWLQQIKRDNAQGEYYLTDIVEFAYKEGGQITSFQPSNNDEVLGINSRIELAQVERRFQSIQVERFMRQGVTFADPSRVDIRGDVEIGADTIIDINSVIEGPTEIGNGVTIAPNCVIKASQIADKVAIHANTVIEQSIIAENANIGPFARLRPGTQCQANVRIGNFVETKNAILADGVKINHLSYIGDAQVGVDTNIGAGVITCNYDGAYKHQTVIGQRVFVGSDCQLVAPVSIEDGATIGAGSTITDDVGKNQLAVSRIKQRNIDDWQRPAKKK